MNREVQVYRKLSDQIAYLEALTDQELHDWILQALTSGDTGRIDLSRYEELTAAMVDLVRRSSNLLFQQRFRRAIAELVDDWSTQFQDHTEVYLLRLVVLAGRLKVTASRSSLLDYARSGRFKPVQVNGRNVHEVILRVIWGMGLVGSGAMAVFADEIEEPDSNYTVLCFTALYEANFKYGLRFLPLMIKHAVRKKAYVEFDKTFKLFIQSSSNAEFRALAERLPKIVARFDFEELQVFTRAMKNAGCIMYPMGIFRIPGSHKKVLVKLNPVLGRTWDMVEIKSIPRLRLEQLSLPIVMEDVDERLPNLAESLKDVVPENTLGDGS